MSNEQLEKEARASLQRIQDFDAKSLQRTAELGVQLSFQDAVKPAQKLIDVFKRIPISILGDLVDSQLQSIKALADAEYNRFKQILDFSADQNSAYQNRNALIQQVVESYNSVFPQLWQYIAYGVAHLTDATSMENQARAVLQDIQDKATSITDTLEAKRNDADEVLRHIQQVAAEQGVSQQAQYFKDRAEEHLKQAKWWRNATAIAMLVTIGFAIFSALAYKIPWLKMGDQYDAIEFITGKILVFVTLAGAIALCAKNFMSHKHNEVLNRHRQTALQTYKVLVDAGASAGSQDIVLAYAASCIFGNQETGFAKEGAEGGASKSVLELMTKSAVGSTAH